MAQALMAAQFVDWARYEQARALLGGNFFRLLSYFREDGDKSVAQIEDALRAHDAVGMIGPADLLKSEAVQMGALGLAQLAERIEEEARDCLELHLAPDILLEPVVALRSAFESVVDQLERETSPLVRKQL